MEVSYAMQCTESDAGRQPGERASNNVDISLEVQAARTDITNAMDDEQYSHSDSDASPVPSSTFSDFNDSSSKSDSESLPSTWGISSFSSSTPTQAVSAPTIADPHAGVHPAWILPVSPPSPPLQYDPRCRPVSPDTPSPLFAKWQMQESTRPGVRKTQKPSKLNTTYVSQDFAPGTSRLASSQYEADPPLSAIPLSRVSSILSSTESSISYEDAQVASIAVPPFLFQNVHHIDLQSVPSHQYPIAAQASRSYAPVHQHTQHPQHAKANMQAPNLTNQVSRRATFLAQEAAPSYPASGRLWAEPRRTASHAYSYSTAVGPRARSGLAKLTRVREPTSSGKKRIRPTSKHAHKRSCSVQWQQFERWQSKSRARLRDLLLLLLAMCIGTVVIWQLCFTWSRPSLSASHRKPRILPHLAALPEPQRDTIVLYRILGNDLPPRHEIGQTLRNIRFMLSHENDFSHFCNPRFSPYNLKVEKYYVLNRITNHTALDSIMSLLKEFNVTNDKVLNIPFDIEEYKRRELRWDGGVAVAKNLWSIGTPGSLNPIVEDVGNDLATPDTPEKKDWRLKRELMTKLRAMEYITHDKNLYAINNNGGRNFALEHGRSLPHARWILPFDGNCFLTPSAMASVIQSVATEAEGKYSKRHVIVPMARLLDNQDVLAGNSVPWSSNHDVLQDLEIPQAEAPEEPQVGFRWDSPVSYQSAMRYGRRSKLELLWRLGAIPFNRGLHIKRLPWEKQDHLHITPQSYASAVNSSVAQRQTGSGISHGDFAQAGWVHRLFSGDTSQEHSTTRAAELRRLNRMRGIIAYLENLDVKTALTSSSGLTLNRLWRWKSTDLAFLKTPSHASVQTIKLLQEAHELLRSAEHALRTRPRNYWREIPSSMPLRDASRLALAGYVSSDLKYLRASVQLAMALVPDPMAATHEYALEYGQPPVGYAFPTLPAALLDSRSTAKLPYDPFTFDISSLLDIFSLIKMSGQQSSLGEAQLFWISEMEDVFARHLRVLLLSQPAIDLSRNPYSREVALAYDTAVASLAAYLDMPTIWTRVASRHTLRYIDPATGDPDLRFLTSKASSSFKAKYETFKRGLDNVALINHDNSSSNSNSSQRSILDNLSF